MKEKMIEILHNLQNGTLNEQDAMQQLLYLFVDKSSLRKIADDNENDTDLARFVKNEMRQDRVAYNAIAKEYPDWTSLDISRYIKTVCGWSNDC